MFTKHTEKTAPSAAAAVLAKAKARYGFIPNLAAYLAESPQALAAVLQASEQYDATTLTPAEQQVVLLTVSSYHDCAYCRTVHKALGRQAGLDTDVIRAIIGNEPLKDPRLAALRDFARAVVDQRGRVPDAAVRAFLEAGFTRAQVFEVVLGVALKTLTNYGNHLAKAMPNPEFIAMADGALAA